MDTKNIRNFSIIAHIDHGKSTLADRMIEITATVEKRKMREQVLDKMDLERERGITIKMTPVRMQYTCDNEHYILNLIDTPGHIDFSYEVSRSLKAVEGALLLVDATQGVQAQTFSTLALAQKSNLVIIPVVTKIDLENAHINEVKEEIVNLLKCSRESILEVSGKTGEGVEALLEEIVKKVPTPRESAVYDNCRALVFDFEYSTHRGVIVYARIFDGEVTKNTQLLFGETKERFSALDVGVFLPDPQPKKILYTGEIGYIVTGIKEPSKAFVGDTVTFAKEPLESLSGYKKPQSVVWASLYPESQPASSQGGDDFVALRQGLERLSLSDSALSFEEEMSTSLGRGFRCGFLGMLHLEVTVERLRREFGLELIVTTPSIVYEVLHANNTREKIFSPAQFPEAGSFVAVYEPWADIAIISPRTYVGDIMQLLFRHEGLLGESSSFSNDRVKIEARVPLRELMRGFFDELKSVSSGYASLSYSIRGMEKADVIRLDILVADEKIGAFTQVVSKSRVYDEAKRIVERLYAVLPKQLFSVKIQGRALGRILSSKTLSAIKKDVTGHLYGGDITRKRKLWEKQKKGKKKMKERGKVTIPHEVFLKMIKMDD